ncbi:MAG: hypothetical protein IJ300_10445 [Clostridia bacterium]|nr:hypothetical protein [Clostridia bacterium]MBQ8146400.1 hypothetical protein [Clostridia bacterium]MBQ8768022.1 hypothetical protein [Clostridia bacterium]
MLFRITAYHKELDISVIMDCDGKFNYLQQFSLYMQNKGFMVLEQDKEDTMLNGNIKPPKSYPNNVILRACHYGRPIDTTFTQNGVTYKAVQVNRKIYVPDKDRTI